MDLLPDNYYAKLYSISTGSDGSLELTFTNAETIQLTSDTVNVLTKVLNCPPNGRDLNFCPHCGEALND